MQNKDRTSKLKTILSGKSFFSNILALVSGSVIAQAITIVAAPILTQLYTPAEMGVYSNYISILTVLSAVVCMRYDQAIVLPEGDDDAINVIAVCVCTAIVFCAICAALVIPMRKQIAELIHADKLDTWLCFLPLSLLTVGITTTLHYWNSRKRNLKNVALFNTAAVSITSSTQVLAGTDCINLNGGMIPGHIIGHGMAAIAFLVYMLKKDLLRLRKSIQPSRMRDMVSRYRNFPIYVVPASLCDTLCAALPSLLLAGYFDSTVSGYYALSYRMLTLPLSAIGAAISQAFYPEACVAYHEGRLQGTVLKMFMLLLRIGTIPLILLALVAPNLIMVIFGGVWYTSGQYVQWLAVWLLLMFVYSPLSSLFPVIEQQDKCMKLNAVVLVARATALIGGGLSGNHMVAIAACGIIGAIMSLISCIYVLHQVEIEARYVLSCLKNEILHCVPYTMPTVIALLITGQSLWSTGVAIASGCVFLLTDGKTVIAALRKKGFQAR